MSARTHKQLLSQVVKLAKLIIINPATNAASERTFSALRRIKTYLRTTMTEARFNHLMLLYVHKDKTSALCMVEIANDVVRESKYRLCIFRKIFSSDLANVQPKRMFHFLNNKSVINDSVLENIHNSAKMHARTNMFIWFKCR